MPLTDTDVERLRKAVLEIVFDALWETPETVEHTIEHRTGHTSKYTALSSKAALTWGGKVDALFNRAKSGSWKPEEV